jgi:hypothetical protein
MVGSMEYSEGEGAARAAPWLFAGGLHGFLQPVARFILALFAAERMSITGPAYVG